MSRRIALVSLASLVSLSFGSTGCELVDTFEGWTPHEGGVAGYAGGGNAASQNKGGNANTGSSSRSGGSSNIGGTSSVGAGGVPNGNAAGGGTLANNSGGATVTSESPSFGGQNFGGTPATAGGSASIGLGGAVTSGQGGGAIGGSGTNPSVGGASTGVGGASTGVGGASTGAGGATAGVGGHSSDTTATAGQNSHAGAGSPNVCNVNDVRPCASYPYAPSIPDSTKCKNGDTCASPCKNGKQTCVASQTGQTQWGECKDAVGPQSSDTCDQGSDGNCNGVANEGCTCVNGTTQACGLALGAKGNCASGKTTCVSGAWGECTIKPAANDNCAVVSDDANCNGLSNDTCPCSPGDIGTCSAKLSAKGACAAGTATCNTQGSSWVCSIQPASKDTCELGNDANCNGTSNDGCLCIDGSNSTCATALGAKGACASGTVTCSGGIWGACTIQPRNDSCDSGNDDSCDGKANTPPGGCACLNGSQKSCGACGDGVSTCVAGGWGLCQLPTQRTWYRDTDGDTYGDANNTISCSTQPTGYVAGTGDCCDTATDLTIAAKVHPGADFQTVAANVCGIIFDYNCNGAIEKDAQQRDHCTAYPTCATAYVDFPDSECGQTHSKCSCTVGGSNCTLGCGSAATLGCR